MAGSRRAAVRLAMAHPGRHRTPVRCQFASQLAVQLRYAGQTSADRVCPPPDLNRYARRLRILSPLRLPFRQAGIDAGNCRGRVGAVQSEGWQRPGSAISLRLRQVVWSDAKQGPTRLPSRSTCPFSATGHRNRSKHRSLAGIRRRACAVARRPGLASPTKKPRPIPSTGSLAQHPPWWQPVCRP
jgi:hypothetical protein